MENISEMIKRLYPEGVERVLFEECATYTRGVTYNKKQESTDESFSHKVLRANNITLESNCLNFDDVKLISKDVTVKNNQMLIANDILICAGSGSKEHVGKVAFIDEDINYTFGGFMAVIRAKTNVLPRYLFHILISSYFKDYLSVALNSTTINNLSLGVMAGFEIPLPPLPIQQEIVRILDSFTSIISNLETELASRQKQYEYYRNKLLTFDENDGSVEWKTLGEVVAYSKERIHASLLNETNYVSVENLLQNKAGKVNSSCCPTDGNWIKYRVGDILIGNIRPNLRKIWLADIDGGTNGDVLTIHICDTYKELLDSKYLYYILSSEDFFLFDIQNAKGAKMPRGDKDAVLRYPISIPPYQRQREIVSTLDTFESLITNIKQELEARKKQYEYYREQLLRFG